MAKNNISTAAEHLAPADCEMSNLPQKLQESLRAVVDYLWTAEQEDFESWPVSERQGHIFTHLLCLRQWTTLP